MESFFATLKGELVEGRDYLTRDEARADVFQYVEGFYNRRRLHSAISYQTPEQKAAEIVAATGAASRCPSERGKSKIALRELLEKGSDASTVSVTALIRSDETSRPYDSRIWPAIARVLMPRAYPDRSTTAEVGVGR